MVIGFGHGSPFRLFPWLYSAQRLELRGSFPRPLAGELRCAWFSRTSWASNPAHVN